MNNKASADIFDLATTRIVSSYPAGYVAHDAGSNAAEEEAFVKLVTACNGARPADRIPLLQHATELDCRKRDTLN